jgi:hypothetical protein
MCVVSRHSVTSGYSFSAQTFRFTPYVIVLIRIEIVGSVTFTGLRTNNADPYSGSDFKDKIR